MDSASSRRPPYPLGDSKPFRFRVDYLGLYGV